MKTNSRMIMLLMTMVSGNFVYGQSNVLPNGDFNYVLGISGWTAEGTEPLAYTGFVDADNAANSGSLVLNYADNTHPQHAVSECFTVSASSPFHFGGKFENYNFFGIISSAEMTCSSYSDASCSSGEENLGLATGVDQTQSNTNPNFVSWPQINGTLNVTAKSAQCTVSTLENDGGGFPNMSTAGFTYVDDLYFTLGASAPVLLGGYLSGSWYDPTTSGQGFEMEFTAQGNTLLATWFTYSSDNSGTTQWVYGQGTYDPTQTTVTIPAVLTSGTGFIPNFVKADVKKTPWGNLTFSFIDCNHATLSWTSTLPGYGSGTEQLQRLTSIAGTSCPQ